MQRVERHKKLHLSYKTADGQNSTSTLNGSVRWFDSVFANSLFAIIPGGWVVSVAGIATDYFTENIWELPSPQAPQVTSKPAMDKKPALNSLVIAPVQAGSLHLSEYALNPALEALKTKFPDATITTYKDYSEAFEAAEWDYKKRSSRKWKMIELFQELNTSHLAVAHVSRLEGQKYRLDIKIYDVISDELISEQSTTITFQEPKNKFLETAKSYLSTLIPNSVGISQNQTKHSGVIFPETKDELVMMNFYHFGSSDNDSKETSEKYFSLSFSNVEPQQGRKFDFVYKLKSDFTISQTTRQLGQISTVRNSSWTSFEMIKSDGPKITSYSIGPGLGPELGIVGALGYLYLNIIYSLEYQYHQFTGDHSGSMSDLTTPITLNLGYSIAATRNLHFSVNGGIKSLSGSHLNQLYSKALNEKITSSYTSETIYTFSLHYYFPEMRRFTRQKLTSL